MTYQAHHQYPQFKFENPVRMEDGQVLYEARFFDKGPDEPSAALTTLIGKPGAWRTAHFGHTDKTFKTRVAACQDHLNLGWDKTTKSLREWYKQAEQDAPPWDGSKFTPEIAHLIYNILVEEVGAQAGKISPFLVEADKHCGARANFVHYYTNQWNGGFSEWRFQGCLGFGGKFWTRRQAWNVVGYPEDQTSYRNLCGARATTRLTQLRIKFLGHPTIPVQPDW